MLKNPMFPYFAIGAIVGILAVALMAKYGIV